MPKIYTRGGDAGETGIWGGRRVRKDTARVAAIGTVDELAAAVGTALAGDLPQRAVEVLNTVQDALFVVGCELMAPERTGPGAAVPRLRAGQVGELETVLDELAARPATPRTPAPPGAARLYQARAVCRRAERYVAAVHHAEGVGPTVPAYLNRLADLLLVLARHAGG